MGGHCVVLVREFFLKKEKAAFLEIRLLQEKVWLKVTFWKGNL